MSFTESLKYISDVSDISERTLWNYVSGKSPEKIPKFKGLCEALECHPAELLTPEWRVVYEGLLIDADALVFDDDRDFLDKSRELRGWSRELRAWQEFFMSGVFRDDFEAEPSDSENQDADLLEEGDAPKHFEGK